MTALMRRSAGEGGAAATELVLVTPLLVLLLLFVAAGGRMVQARGDIDSAARDAARAAATARDAATAHTAAHSAAAAALGGVERPCAPLGVAVDTSGFAAGGSVSVTVTCDVPLADLAPLGLPGTRTFAATAVAPVDAYRGTR